MHFLQIVDDRKGKNHIREKCIASVKNFVTESDTYTVKEIHYADTITMAAEIDKIRISFAREHDDLLYVDNDCFLSALPNEIQMQSEKIIIGGNDTSIDNFVPNTFLFYVNGNKDFFIENYDLLLQRTPDNLFNLSPKQIQLFRRLSIPYDPFSYCHFSLPEIEYSLSKQFNAFIEQIKMVEEEVDSYRSAIQNLNKTVQLFDQLRKKENG